MDALLQRQVELISCLGLVTGVGKAPSNNSAALDLIAGVKRQLATEGISSSGGGNKIEMMELLGEGAFGKVYKGLWNGSIVAVKSMVLPLSSHQRHERMAISKCPHTTPIHIVKLKYVITFSLRIFNAGLVPLKCSCLLFLITPPLRSLSCSGGRHLQLAVSPKHRPDTHILPATD